MAVSTSDGPHSPSPAQAHASQVHVSRHVRRCVPHRPQEAPLSNEPVLHSPWPMHVPSLAHTLSAPQSCASRPQLPQLTSRVCPGSQLQSLGALQGSHTPSTQRSTPGAHALRHARSTAAPTSGSASSQSDAVAMPSPSTSAIVSMQTPRTHVKPSGQSPGVHKKASTGTAASRVRLGSTGLSAHPAIESATDATKRYRASDSAIRSW